MNKDKAGLYVYDLDPKVASSLELLYFDSLTQEEVRPEQALTEANLRQNDETNANIIKPQSEGSIDPEYYKSDLYRYNLKRSINNLAPLTEDEFEKLLEEQSIESLSGSESESEDEDDSENKKLESLIKQIDLESSESNPEENTVSHLNSRSSWILFKSSLLPPTNAYGVYKGLFNDNDLLHTPLETLRSFTPKYKTGKSALFMIGGGHFAGAIISHVCKNTRGNAINHKESKYEQAVDVIVSKTFHRYTTRRKQGGAQSASDNARGKANSAGSSIRRYNEQALIKEVRELLQEWSGRLKDCTNIFIRANGASNRKILVGYEGSVLKNDDKRIKGFPFTTKRATTSELKRAWVELTYLKVMELPKVNEKAKKKIEKEAQHEQAKIEETHVDPKQVENDKLSVELVSLLKKQKAPKLLSFVKQNHIDVNEFRLSPESKYTQHPTLLHYASANNLDHMVVILLGTLKALPSIRNAAGRSPAEVTSDMNTRHAFQIARAKLGESFCDWDECRVGPAKSKEEFAKEEEEEKERLQSEKKRRIQEELSKKTEMELRKPKVSASGTLGGTVGASINDLSGLSDQQKMRLMREQRARAAEARFKAA